MSKPTAGYLTGMLTLTFPGAEPVEIGSISLPVGVTTGPGGITTRLIVDTEQASRDIRAIFATEQASRDIRAIFATAEAIEVER